jgi:hypothetical protein
LVDPWHRFCRQALVLAPPFVPAAAEGHAGDPWASPDKSMGGTYDHASEHPDLLYAAIPCAGGAYSRSEIAIRALCSMAAIGDLAVEMTARKGDEIAPWGW